MFGIWRLFIRPVRRNQIYRFGKQRSEVFVDLRQRILEDIYKQTSNMTINMIQLLALFYVIKIFIYIK